MSENKILRFICSIPVILILLYFLPFIGICLVFFRYFIYKDKKIYELPIVLLIVALFLLLPRGAYLLLTNFKMDVNLIPYLDVVNRHDMYIKIVKYSKFIFTMSIITLIVSYLVKTLYYNVKSKLSSAFSTTSSTLNTKIDNYMAKEAEIHEKNDLKIKEQREKANNTHHVKCGTCGHEMLVSDNQTKCPFCGNPLSERK